MMRKAGIPTLFFLLAVLLNTCLQAQTIYYSRPTLKLPIAYDKIQLIPDVGGNNHLLFFRKSATIRLYNFDRELKPLSKKELPIKFSDTCETRILAFKNFYLLYMHKPGSTRHELWKINAAGEANNLSSLFQNFIDTAFKKRTATLQLINKDDQLAVISNIYYEELKTLITTIVTVDEKFKTLSATNISYAFELGPDRLNQVTLVGEYLYILKSTRRSQHYMLELLKADVSTGKLFSKTFNSNNNFTRDAAFQFIAADSSILIHSIAGAQLFISKLDMELEEKSQPALVPMRFGSNVATHFLLLGGEVQQWLSMSLPSARLRSTTDYNYVRSYRSLSQAYPYNSLAQLNPLDYNIQMYGRTLTGFGSSATGYLYSSNGRMVPVDNAAPAIRFSVMDKNFKLLSDSIVNNKKGPVTVSASEYANFLMGTKNYLILKQDFRRARKGLLLVTADYANQITTTDITVYEKYEYLLEQAQPINNESVLMPYVQKWEVGLVRLSFPK